VSGPPASRGRYTGFAGILEEAMAGSPHALYLPEVFLMIH